MTTGGDKVGKHNHDAFEQRFRVAAHRVLRRHGVPEERMDSEIARLREKSPSVRLPTIEALERMIAEDAKSV